MKQLHIDLILVTGCHLVSCVKCPIDNEVIYRRHPHLLAKDVKLGFFTPFPPGMETIGRRMEVHNTPLRNPSSCFLVFDC